MDKNLWLLLHLYGEEHNADDLDELLKDGALSEEYRQLGQVKSLLDQRRVHPDPARVAHVLRAAAPNGLHGAADTTRRRPRMRLIRRVSAWSAFAAAAAVAALLVWPLDPDDAVAPDSAPSEAASESTEVLPPWDDGSQLVDVYTHIEVLSARSTDDAWDEPEVLRIDSLPPAGASSGFTPASAFRQR